MHINKNITTDNASYEAKASSRELCFSFISCDELASKVFQFSSDRFNPYYIVKHFFKKGKFDEFNLLSKLKNTKDQNTAISRLDKAVELAYLKFLDNTDESQNFRESTVDTVLIPKIKIDILFSGSIKELLRRMAQYTGLVQSTLFNVLRNTRIHSLSIFFGLCCSSSGYIFEAITGTSSHPVPTSL